MVQGSWRPPLDSGSCLRYSACAEEEDGHAVRTTASFAAAAACFCCAASASSELLSTFATAGVAGTAGAAVVSGTSEAEAALEAAASVPFFVPSSVLFELSALGVRCVLLLLLPTLLSWLPLLSFAPGAELFDPAVVGTGSCSALLLLCLLSLAVSLGAAAVRSAALASGDAWAQPSPQKNATLATCLTASHWLPRCRQDTSASTAARDSFTALGPTTFVCQTYPGVSNRTKNHTTEGRA